MADIEQNLEELEKTEKEKEEQLNELNKIKEETEDYENKKKALELELNRVREAIDKAREEKRNIDKSFVEKLREENLEKAKSIFSQRDEYKNNPEALNALMQTFTKIDDGSVTEDKILEGFQKAHLILNASKYIDMEKKLQNMKSEAETLNRDLSTSAFAEGNLPTEGVELTKEDIEAARWSGLSLERYKELKAKGKI